MITTRFRFLIILLMTPFSVQALDLSKWEEHFVITQENNQWVIGAHLQDVIAFTLSESLHVKAAKKGVFIAEQNLASTQNRIHPTLTNRIEQTEHLTPFFSPQISDSNFLSVIKNRSSSLSSQYSQRNASGVEYGVSYSESKSRSHSIAIDHQGDINSSVPTDWIYNSQLKGFVTIPIYQDWGKAIHDIPIRFAESGVKNEKNRMYQSLLDLTLHVASTYWDLVGLLESLAVQQQAVTLSKKLLSENQTRFHAGDFNKIDLQVTETQLAREQQQLLSLELDIAKVEDQIRAALNLDGYPFKFKPLDSPHIRLRAFEEADLLNKMFRTHPQIISLNIALEQKKHELLQLQNKQLPDIDLFLEYATNGYQDNALEGASYFGESELGEGKVSLSWKVPLFDEATPRNILKNGAEIEQIHTNIKKVESQLKVQLQSLLKSLQFSEKEIVLAQKTARLANAQLQAEIERFRLGERTSFQVSRSQQEKFFAKQQEILARIRHEKLTLELLGLSGKLFEYFNVSTDFFLH